MKAAQLRNLLARAGYTVRSAAEELDIHERTLHRYLSGEDEIPRAVDLAARWLHEHREPESDREVREALARLDDGSGPDESTAGAFLRGEFDRIRLAIKDPDAERVPVVVGLTDGRTYRWNITRTALAAISSAFAPVIQIGSSPPKPKRAK